LADPKGTEREAEILGLIGSHDYIVSIYDYDTDPDSVQFMVFEYLSGGTLTDYLREAGPLPLEDILRFARQLSRGLSHLHGRGLIHRDVSPSNIWLDERGVAHLGDFDSATMINSSDTDRPITTNSFAAPEERDGGPLDIRSDLYSLGGVLHVLAAGLTGDRDINVLRQRPGLPSSYADLVGALLADSPDDRPADTAKVLDLLDEVRHASKVADLIAAGESAQVEFKASLHHLHDPLPRSKQAAVERGHLSQEQAEDEIRKEVQRGVTRAIASFLNTDGGTLLIGISDSGTVLGIEHDFPYLGKKPSYDGWMLSLKGLITASFSDDVWAAITVSLVHHGGAAVAVVNCPKRMSETWHCGDGIERFFIRTSNASCEIVGPALSRYIRERWPA
jgi:serine/threonine protein kinase